MSYETTFHQDGTVTVWSCVRKNWLERCLPETITDEVLATLPEEERDRIIGMAEANTPKQGTIARTLRLPNGLNARMLADAGRKGQSVTTWLNRAVEAHLPKDATIRKAGVQARVKGDK